MRPRTLLVLFLLVAGLAAFIWFVEGELPGTDEKAARAKKLLAFDRQAITRLEIERGGEHVAFERNGERDWAMVEPVAGLADLNAVESLLDELEALEKERTFADGDVGSLGLAPPRAVITLEGGDGEQRLFIGSDVPASESMIATTDTAGPFHVVTRAVWAEADRPADAWRERKLFPGMQGDIERLVFVRGEDRLEIARRNDGFFLEAPLEDRADAGTMSRFLSALASLEVTEFIDDGRALVESSRFAAAPRALEVSIRGRETPWRLEIGRALDVEVVEGSQETGRSLFVRAAGHVYLVSDTVSEAVDRPAQQWRSLEWSGRQVHEIDRVEIRDEAGTMVLESVGGDWRRDGVKIEYGVMSDLLYAITGIKAEALDAGEAIAGLPLLSATLDTADGRQVLEIFPPRGDSYPATVSDRDSALWLGGDGVRNIVSEVATVRAAPGLEEEIPASAAGAPPPTASGLAAATD